MHVVRRLWKGKRETIFGVSILPVFSVMSNIAQEGFKDFVLPVPVSCIIFIVVW
jgi:hypothetical protein